ncbi:hypothetical protein [Streptomyces caniscabiei]|uniref:hypothetical protein n=1 Tax=Streptomyces caniscabiei TaxID=2746961 RepID=UPI000766035D|nr:hypothetical protein [Streptomyces caniscabiei]
MTQRVPLDHLTSDQYDQLCNQLDALRAVARGYCPQCGRGDAAPTLADWEQQKQRADSAEEFSRRALEQRQEMAAERYAWQQRGDRAEAALVRVRALAARIRHGAPWTANHDNIADRIEAAAALGEAGPAATQATEFQPFTPPHIPRVETTDSPLVVEPYRNDRHQNVWVFRCWGTKTCDGWLSLDHHSQQSAERARDRHVAEAHPEEKP